MRFVLKCASILPLVVLFSACGNNYPTKEEVLNIIVQSHSNEVRFNYSPDMNTHRYSDEEKEKLLLKFKNDLSIDNLSCKSENKMKNVYNCHAIISNRETGRVEEGNLKLLRKSDNSLSMIR